MNTIKHRSGRLKAHLRKRLLKGVTDTEQFLNSRTYLTNDRKTIMEMWDNYLTFARAEF